ncbi:MAG TPA: DJ-1/PfpI family protein [Candidatus Sulfotelmatobacter sp.]|nr:DJ-1/PfpI family protein [Candidatus Sulfotelmatobacter sp.]
MKLIALFTLIAGLAAATAQAKPYTRNVAIVVYENAEPLDWTGPFEVYNDAANFGSANGEPAFRVYIVSKNKQPLNAQGLWVAPSYSIQDAPRPDIVVFPGGPSSKIYDDPEFFAWAKKASVEAEIAQSVCTGAFVLGKAGLLDGLEVTTFHGAIDDLQRNYPKAAVKRGRRFVDNGHVVTTAGISAGIDGSLHVVARLLGRRVADQVATYMEYAWSPEASLATNYSYFNPSTDDRGRLAQSGDIQYDEKRYAEAEQIYRSILARDGANRDAWGSLGRTLGAQGKHAEAADAIVRSAEGTKDHMTGWTYYQAAAEYAQAGKKDQAIATLEKAFDSGFNGRSRVANDPEFASIMNEPRVQHLLAVKP